VVANGHQGPVPILQNTAKWGPGDPRESATENTQPIPHSLCEFELADKKVNIVRTKSS